MLVVAPAEVDFSDPAHLDTIRAFMIRAHEAVNLALGTIRLQSGPGRPRGVAAIDYNNGCICAGCWE